MAKHIEPAAHQHEPDEADQEPRRERNVGQTFKHRCASLQRAVGQGDVKRPGNVLRFNRPSDMLRAAPTLSRFTHSSHFLQSARASAMVWLDTEDRSVAKSMIMSSSRTPRSGSLHSKRLPNRRPKLGCKRHGSSRATWSSLQENVSCHYTPVLKCRRFPGRCQSLSSHMVSTASHHFQRRSEACETVFAAVSS